MNSSLKTTIFLFLPLLAFSQDPNLGLIFSPDEYNSLKKLPTDFGGGKGEELPFKNSLKKYMPPIAKQGKCFSCVGWSVGYYAMTITVAQRENWSSQMIASNAFSASFIYNQINEGDCRKGTTIPQAANVIIDQGNVRSVEFDYPVCECDRLPNGSLGQSASSHKIENFYPLFSSDAPINEKIFKTKKALSEGMPVIAGMRIMRNLIKPVGGFWDPNGGDTTPFGGHAMTVVGYDNFKGAFEIANSWGANWGNEGYIWVKFEDFANHAIESYVLVSKGKDDQLAINKDNIIASIDDKAKAERILSTKKQKAKKAKSQNALKGEFEFRVPQFDEYENLNFSYPKPKHESGFIYTLEKKDWQLNDMYQLVVKGMQKGIYIYVFSMDQEGHNIHWPRNASYSSKFYGFDEASIIPFDDVKIIIPGEEMALTKRAVYEDYIIILYSDKEIKNFEERVKKVQFGDKETFSNSLKLSFGDLLVPNENIGYFTKEMAFFSTNRLGKQVVPIVLMLEDR